MFPDSQAAQRRKVIKRLRRQVLLDATVTFTDLLFK